MVKNILFDFGGVFIDVDYKRTERSFIDAGITNFGEFYSQQSASPLFEDLEKGKLNGKDFYVGLRKATGVDLSDETITTCWNSILGQYYPQALEKAKELRNKYRLFLFSNTNAIHYERFMQIYRQQFCRDDFHQLFEKVYYSHLAGIRKPYPEAYTWVLNDAGIAAGETLFIDDTYANIEGAAKAGLQALHLKPPIKLWELDL